MRMRQVEERYISLLTDFGFKRIFGTAINKDLLICFLNSLFDGKQVVKDVSYLNPEHVGDVYTDRKAIFDVYCVTRFMTWTLKRPWNSPILTMP